MADIYGSSLDSLMQNRVAQEQADQAETNSYRNYLAAMTNARLKGQEQEAMDRYRMGDLGVRQQLGLGDLGIRQQDVLGNNEYRRGQIKIGETNAATNKDEVANRLKIAQMQDDLGWARYYMPPAATDLEKATADYQRALADKLKNDPLSGVSENQRMLMSDDISRRKAASGYLTALNQTIQAAAGKSSSANQHWYGETPEYKEAKVAAAGLPGGATESNIQRMARQLAFNKAIPTIKSLGYDPTVFSFNADTGEASVAESPYAALLNRRPSPAGGFSDGQGTYNLPNTDYSKGLSLDNPLPAASTTPSYGSGKPKSAPYLGVFNPSSAAGKSSAQVVTQSASSAAIDDSNPDGLGLSSAPASVPSVDMERIRDLAGSDAYMNALSKAKIQVLNLQPDYFGDSTIQRSSPIDKARRIDVNSLDPAIRDRVYNRALNIMYPKPAVAPKGMEWISETLGSKYSDALARAVADELNIKSDYLGGSRFVTKSSIDKAKEIDVNSLDPSTQSRVYNRLLNSVYGR